MERRLAAILSADAVGYSRLMSADEAGTIRVLTAYRKAIAELVAEHRGRVVDSPGDNLLAEFPTALDAIACAVEVQRVLAARNAGLAEEGRMRFRIGVHLGDVSVEDGRLYGDGVNIAARLEAMAPPGGLCLSGEVQSQVAGKLELEMTDLGEVEVKNLPRPVRAWRAVVDETAPRVASGSGARFRALAALIAAAALAAGAFGLGRLASVPEHAPGEPVHLRVDVLGEGRLTDRSFPPIALSPDGRTLAYAASTARGSQLFVRSLGGFEALAMPGTEGAHSPFFSPDGAWIGFFAQGRLQKVHLAGGLPTALCDLGNLDRPSGHWGPDGVIVFSRGVNNSSGILSVSSAGGEPSQVTTPDVDSGESWHGLPQRLASGELLFSVVTADGFRAALLPADGRRWRVLEELGPAIGARALPDGRLVYGQPGRLMSVGWQADGRPGASPVTVLEGVHTTRLGLPMFSTSQRGDLLYVPGSVVRTTPVLLDAAGRATPVTDDPGAFQHPRFSPDGRFLAVDVASLGRTDIFVYELSRGTRRRLTERGFNLDPLWTRDGGRILFRSMRAVSGQQDLYWTRADGSGAAELLRANDRSEVATAWGPSGRFLTFTDISSGEALSLWALDVGGEAPPRRLVSGRENAGWGDFSPDGRFIAYVSDASGRREVWVRPFGTEGAAQQASPRGGREPRWAPDGKRLFYRDGERFFAVDIETEPGLSFGEPVELFAGRYDRSPNGHQHWDLHPAGDRFALIELGGVEDRNVLHLVLDWTTALDRLVPLPD